MARRQLLQRLARRMAADDDITVVLDDADIPTMDPAGRTASARGAQVPADLPVPADMDPDDYRAALTTLANRLCRNLSTRHHADHVAVWRLEGADFVMVGASGLNSAWRGHRIAHSHGAVRMAAMHDDVLVEDIGARDSHVVGLPGRSAAKYAVIIVREGPLVDLVTVSGDKLDDAEAVAIAAEIKDEAAVWQRAARREHFEALIGDA